MARSGVDPSDVDDLDHPVKRWISLLIVAVTFLATVVGYLQQQASGNESAAGTEARRKGIEAVGIDVAVQAELASDLDVGLESFEARRRTEDARSVLEAGDGGAGAAEEVERFEAVHEALEPLSPLLGVKGLREGDDPHFPNRLVLDRLVRSDRASLRHAAAAEVARYWNEQSGRYFLLLTVIAVALLLLGLALVAGDRARMELTVTAVVLTVVSLGLTAGVARRTVPATPEAAIERTAQGLRAEREQRTYGTSDYGDAIDAYTDAIRLRPDYALAYARRGLARFTQGAKAFELLPVDDRKLVPFSDERAVAAAIADLQQALNLGGARLGNEVSGHSRFGVDLERMLGYCYFLAGSYEQAEHHLGRSIVLDDGAPLTWAYRGAVHAARAAGAADAERDAERTAARRDFERAIALIEGVLKDNREKGALYTAARSALEWVVHKHPATSRVATELKQLMVMNEMRTLGEATYGPEFFMNVGKPGKRGSFEVAAPVFDPAAATLTSAFVSRNVPIGTPVVGLWYFRPGPQAPWNEARQLYPTANNINVLTGTASEAPSLFGAEAGPMVQGAFTANLGPCPTGGEYRIEAYDDGFLTASAQAEIRPGPAGAGCG